MRLRLFTEPGFNLLDAFKLIDRTNSGKFDSYKLYSFLRDQQYVATNEELAAVIRRMDLDDDEQVSYSEFKDFLPPEYVIHDKYLSDNERYDHNRKMPKGCICINCKSKDCCCAG